MADKEEVHPLVTLLLERMKSHPEEFEDHFCCEPEMPVASTRDRWGYAINEIRRHGSDADNEALVEGLRPLRLDKAHKWALDELLNGDARRAQERREWEEREKMYKAQAAKQAQALAQGYVNANPAMLGGNQPYLSTPAHVRGGYLSSLLGKLKP